MTITTHLQEYAFGHLVNYKLYQPAIPSKYYLIFLHGQGECGVSDGSQISKLEIHGYPKHAKNGYEFPFNIIAPQVATSYTVLNKFFPAYIKLKYNAEAIIVTGLSLGGYATFNMRALDYLNVIYAIAPVCGGYSALGAIDYPETFGWAFHGDKDTTVPYFRSKQFVDAYNETHERKIDYTLYEGVGHNAWDRAYSLDGPLLPWIIEKFEAAPKSSVSAIKQKLHDVVDNLFESL